MDADRPCKKMRLRVHKTLVIGGEHPYIAFTQFARACGRVLVGGHPDKRPDSRQGLEDGWRGWTSLKSRLPVSARKPFPDTDRQPEAKPANPESPRGTQLKATTERAFLVSTGIPTPARATEEACPSLPGVRAGNPNQSTAAQFGLSFRLCRVSTVRQRLIAHTDIIFGRPVAKSLGRAFGRVL